MPISCSLKELARRHNSITNLLKPVLPNGQKLAASRFKRASANEYILTAHSGSPTDDYRRNIFKTKNPDYRGNYFEQWYIGHGDTYLLKSASMNFFYNNDEKILSLHCDPNEEIGSPHYKYKTGPHLHVDGRFKHAHIALNLSNLDQVIHSIIQLEKAFAIGLTMIDDEFIL